MRRRPGYSAVVDDSNTDQALLHQEEYDWEALEADRDHFLQKTNDLEELLRSCALELVTQEKELVLTTLQAQDVAAELDELKAQIETPNEEKEHSKAKQLQRMLSFWNHKQQQNNHGKASSLTPEKSMDLALNSLKASIEYFQDERAILTCKIDNLKGEAKTKKIKFDETIESMKHRVADLEEERDLITQKYKLQHEDRVQFELALLKMADQMEILEDIKQSLELECDVLAQDLETTRTQYTTKEQERREEDQEIISTMRMMQDYIETLEHEKDVLASQVMESKQNASEKYLQNLTLSTEAETVDTEDESLEDNKLQIRDLKQEHEQLKRETSFKENTIAVLQQENTHMKSRIESLTEDKDRLTNKIELQELAVSYMCDDDSEWKSQVQALKKERDQLRLKCEAKQQEIGALKQQRPQQDLNGGNEQLASRCITLEGRLAVLEIENESLKCQQESSQQHVGSTMVNLKAKVEELEEEVDKSRVECRSQQATIALLKKERQVNDSIEEERAKAVAEAMAQMEAQIQELEAQREELNAKCSAQERAIATFEKQSDLRLFDVNVNEETAKGTEETDYTMEEMKEYIEELENVKQRIASKSSSRESAIALLEEQNELKDARLQVLENMVQSLMVERGQGPRASRWREQLDKLPWIKRRSEVPSVEQVLSAINREEQTPPATTASKQQEIFSQHNSSMSDSMSVVSQ